MESISLTQEERRALIRKMKRETQPSRRLWMHIALLAADGHSPTEIAHVLYCSRTTVYAITRRFRKEGETAFADRERHGWARSRWTCLMLGWLGSCSASVGSASAGRRCVAPCVSWGSSGVESGLSLLP